MGGELNFQKKPNPHFPPTLPRRGWWDIILIGTLSSDALTPILLSVLDIFGDIGSVLVID